MKSHTEAEALLTKPGAPFELTEITVDGRRQLVYKNAPPTLRAVFEGTAQFGDADALVYEDERYTFAEQRKIVAAVAHFLVAECGVQPGDHVAIAARNFPEFVFTFWATQSIGAVLVCLNAWWAPAELEYGLRDSQPKALFVDSERWDRIAPYHASLGVAHTIIIRSDRDSPAGVRDWSEAVSRKSNDIELPAVEFDSDAPATMLYTSGTTGAPKGAVASHRNHTTNIFNTFFFAALARTMADQPVVQNLPSPASLNPFPFFHIGGMSAMYVSAAAGSKLILMYKWDTALALDLCERERVTTIAIVPSLLGKMLEMAQTTQKDLSSLSGIASGAAPVPPQVAKQIEDTFGGRVVPTHGYGLTETTSGASATSGSEYLDHPSSAGKKFPVNRLKVVDTSGEVLHNGEVGELWIYGPNVVQGYWNKPDATEAAFTDGWFHSGDLARIDDDGFIYVVDRLKDVIIRGGENVYSAEIESCLLLHPSVEEAAVIGLPEPELGEEVCAVVVGKGHTSVDGDELTEWVKGRLAYFKVPTRWFIQSEPLPRTATTKVLKRQLRQQLISQGDGVA